MLDSLKFNPNMLLDQDDPVLTLLNQSVDGPTNCLVVIPDELEACAQTDSLYGYLRMESGYHAILGWAENRPIAELDATWVGALCGSSEDQAKALDHARSLNLPACILGGRGEDGALAFRLHMLDDEREMPLEKRVFSFTQNVFSRNSGLLETDWLEDRCVVIGGVGSVGSCFALQMARSGVGRFVLCDSDCMEIHNDCRHQCSIKDVGRYKVDAVAERIRQINPRAEIRTFRRRIQDVPSSAYADWVSEGHGLFAGCCDNRVGDAYACDAAKAVGAPFIAMGFWERAWGGDLFVYLPMRGDICYRCVYEESIAREIDAERRNHMYVGEERAAQANIVPGIAVDIEFGVSLLSKTALDILNLTQEAYKPRLIFNLGQLNWFCGTADRSAGKEWAHALPEPLSLRKVALPDALRRCACCTPSVDSH